MAFLTIPVAAFLLVTARRPIYKRDVLWKRIFLVVLPVSLVGGAVSLMSANKSLKVAFDCGSGGVCDCAATSVSYQHRIKLSATGKSISEERVKIRRWSIAHLVVGLAMIPQALWGLFGFIGLLLPIVAASRWPIRSAAAGWWLLTSAVAVASAILSLVGATLLLFKHTSKAGLLAVTAGTGCFLAYVIARESMFVALGTRGTMWFNLQVFIICAASLMTTLRLYTCSSGH